MNPKLKPNRWMFIDKPSLTGKANTMNGIMQASYNKVRSQKVGPLRIIKVQPHTVVADKDEVPNIELMHRVTAAPALRKNHTENVQIPSSPRSKTHTTQQHQKKNKSVSVNEAHTSSSECLVDRISRHEFHGQNRHYVVRCY